MQASSAVLWRLFPLLLAPIGLFPTHPNRSSWLRCAGQRPGAAVARADERQQTIGSPGSLKTKGYCRSRLDALRGCHAAFSAFCAHFARLCRL